MKLKVTKQELGTDVLDEFTVFNEHLADDMKHIDYAVASGTDIYTATINNITALTEGLSVKIKFTNANAEASTLNINSLGAKAIKKGNGNDLTSGNIKAGQIAHLVYTGSVFQLLGEGGEYGTATQGDVRSTKTLGTENGVVQGTLEVGPKSIFKANAINDGFSKVTPPSTANGTLTITSSAIALGVGSSHWAYALSRAESDLSYDLTDVSFIIFTMVTGTSTDITNSNDSISMGASSASASINYKPMYNKIVVDVSALSGVHKVFLQVVRNDDGSGIQRTVKLQVSDITFI